jgi:thiamine-monophosphate kinase
MLSVTGIGAMAPGVAPLLRTGARAGDVIAVTGTPGDSAAGLAVLQDRLAVSRADRSYLLSRFWSPTPRVEEGVLLATSGACHACIDMSDGLGQDLGHLARGAGLRARIDAASLPRSPAMARHASRDPDQALSWALGGGEDYELIAAIDPAKFDALARRLQRKGLAPLTRIGSFVKGTGVVLQGSGRRIDWTGFSHFGD